MGMWKYSSRAQKMNRSELAALFQLAEEPDVISFAGGFPDPDWFLDEVREVTARIMKDRKGEALQYGPTPGLTSFREYIADRLSRWGIQVATPEVAITSGSLQGLDLVCRLFLDRGDAVIVEAPIYIGAIQTLEAYEAKMVQVPIDKSGMCTDVLSETLSSLHRESICPKFIYTIPSFQNPSGCTMSLQRRRDLLDIAAHYGIPIVEDDAYGELRTEGRHVPSLKALDEEGQVIYLGTLSKVFSPGLRLGWLVAPQDFVEKIVMAKQGCDQCSNTMGQAIALEYGRRGYIDKQVTLSVRSLAEKRAMTMSALHKYAPAGTTWTEPEGGFYTWLTLPESVDTVRALPAAVREQRVAYVAGPSFYADRRGGNQLRVCYSHPKVSHIPEGIKRLMLALRSQHQ